MSGVNKVILVGHLGRDPEVRTGQDGRRIVSFGLATSETWRDKGTGERRERTEWHRVVIFNDGLGKIAEQYLKKGAKVYVEGANRTRKWTAQDGTDRYTTEVVIGAFRGALTLLDRADRAPAAADESAYGGAAPGLGGSPSSSAQRDQLNDEIPF